MSRPDVSVIMNCLNGARYLREALDSVFAQSYSNWEIVFWDSASSDESASIALSYGDKVRYFRSNSTISLGVDRNSALAQCKGKYITFLDQDDIWLPEKLERQLLLFNANPKLGLVFSDSIVFDEKGDQYKLFDIVSPRRGHVFGDLLAENFIHTVSMMYKRVVFEKLEYVFDDEFNIVMDWDVSLRVAYYYELEYVDCPLTKWRQHSDSATNKKRFLIAKERQLLLERLCNNLPDIKIKYNDQINYYLMLVNQVLALEQWGKGHKQGARKYLLPYIKDTKCLIIYLATWVLTYNLFEKFKVYIMRSLRQYRR